jgi:hypothetical protein
MLFRVTYNGSLAVKGTERFTNIPVKILRGVFNCISVNGKFPVCSIKTTTCNFFPFFQSFVDAVCFVIEGNEMGYFIFNIEKCDVSDFYRDEFFITLFI